MRLAISIYAIIRSKGLTLEQTLRGYSFGPGVPSDVTPAAIVCCFWSDCRQLGNNSQLANRAALYTAFMTNTRKHSMWLRIFSGAPVAVAIMAAAFVASGARAQEQPPLNASDVAEGMRLYQQKGNCQSCHGWAGDGRKTDSQMPDGANLRETKLNRAGLVMTIKCGRLNSQMPAFDKFAYSDGRCYGKKQADLKLYPTRMPDPPATLQQREIDLLADFLIAKIVGKGPMDRAKCVEFWGSETDVCKDFPK